jgi:hypothetical protein
MIVYQGKNERQWWRKVSLDFYRTGTYGLGTALAESEQRRVTVT